MQEYQLKSQEINDTFQNHKNDALQKNNELENLKKNILKNKKNSDDHLYEEEIKEKCIFYENTLNSLNNQIR